MCAAWFTPREMRLITGAEAAIAQLRSDLAADRVWLAGCDTLAKRIANTAARRRYDTPRASLCAPKSGRCDGSIDNSARASFEAVL